MSTGSKARYRTREGLVSPRTIPMGTQITETLKSGIWVQTAQTAISATLPSYRYLATAETCQDYINWPGPPYHFGRNFDVVRGRDGGLIKRPLTSNGWYMPDPNGVKRYSFLGSWMPMWYPPTPFTMKSTFDFDDVDLPDLQDYGPGAYAMYSPTKPKVDMGQFLGEFREIPKMLFDTTKAFRDTYLSMGGHKARFGPKRVASEFLNYNFGWVPFLGTLISFHSVMTNLEKHIKRIVKYNGVWEHRGGFVDDEMVSEDLILSENTVSKTYPSISSAFNSRGTVRIYKRHYRQVWFSGFFRYYIPEIKFRTWWQPEILKMILGLRISPSLLWELTPFSWLFDWFGNIGDILANAEDADIYNLVSRNAFLMGKTDLRFDFESVRFCANERHEGVWTYDYTRKQRVKASPFGFNVLASDLSSRQISILGALGVTLTKGF